MTDIPLALDYLARIMRKKATVFLVSDFMSPEFSRPLSVAGARHDLIAVRVRDRRHAPAVFRRQEPRNADPRKERRHSVFDLRHEATVREKRPIGVRVLDDDRSPLRQCNRHVLDLDPGEEIDVRFPVHGRPATSPR